MRLQLLALFLALFFAFVLAAEDKKSVLITYPENTPAHVIESAMEEIKKAGGFVTHEFNLIKGFAADVADKVLESVQAMGADHGVLIEEDQIVRANSHY